ncbi:Trimeric GatFAB AmidoTransferase(AdT) complex subunit [Nowakowskiella sp. JEL0078]|nr:Trimeric GatFAB AmidoTransferase(AdT) complex subunit [Nowakowskiella sp. JEL0078]
MLNRRHFTETISISQALTSFHKEISGFRLCLPSKLLQETINDIWVQNNAYNAFIHPVKINQSLKNNTLHPFPSEYFAKLQETALVLDMNYKKGARKIYLHLKLSKTFNKGENLKPLDGITVAVKANICTVGLPTTCGSKILDDFESPYDATVVKLLKDAGALIVGKTNLDEFGMGSSNIHSRYGPTINPKRPLVVNRKGKLVKDKSENGTLLAGGSSGGSAVAVSQGMCFAALGSDTGGSVRLPASYCGVTGFKPSYGRFSRYGLIAYASSLDTVGVLTRKVEDLEYIFDVLSQFDENDATSVSFDEDSENEKSKINSLELKNIRIGIPQEYFVDGLTSASKSTWEAGIQFMKQQGAEIVPISLPHTKYAIPVYYVIAPAEASSNLSRFDGVRFGARENNDGHPLYSNTRTAGFGDEVKRRIILGTYVLCANSYNAYFLQAQKLRRLVKQDFDNVFNNSPTFKKVDVILTPAAVSSAPSLSSIRSQKSPVEECVNDVMTVPASLAGLPACVIPFKNDDRGLPIGLQLIGQYGQDRKVIRLSKLMEKGRRLMYGTFLDTSVTMKLQRLSQRLSQSLLVILLGIFSVYSFPNDSPLLQRRALSGSGYMTYYGADPGDNPPNAQTPGNCVHKLISRYEQRSI